MSRAFVNEDLQEEAPLIPPRAALPDGVPNYVTTNGLEELRREHEALEAEREQLHKLEDEREKRYKMQLVQGKIALLDQRIRSARLPDLKPNEHDVVRFGSIVTLNFLKEKRTQTFQIVGVDEANIKSGKIAFTSPIAKSITGKKVNEKVILNLGKTSRELVVVKIA